VVEMTEVDLSSLEILLIDDTPEVRESIARLIEGVGKKELDLDVRVTKAEDGEEGVNTYLRMLGSENGVDAVITDIEMPKKDGYDVLDYIKGLRQLTPVYMATATQKAEDFEERRRMAYERPFPPDGFYQKPIESAVMIEILRDIFAKKVARYVR
jgi:CheY-like chemotaxis protein